MPGKSKTTQPVRIRLPNSVIETIKRRIQKRAEPMTVSSYLRGRIIYDITRKHHKRERG